MCGITGWVHFERNLTGERGIVREMAETLLKRGPDENNLWGGEHVLFGHKRLIVVDPEGGRQPMSIQHKGKSYTICYNGELYNTEDLRDVLKGKGYTFGGHSDTEVLLTSYIEWKEACVDHLNGIFAFAVWDEQEGRVFLARDRLGVKPLFYTEKDGGLLFASEIKALLAHPDIEPEIDLQGLKEVLGLGPSRTPGHGVFRGVQELRPAFAMSFGPEGVKKWRYWNVKSEKHTDSFEETVEKVRFLVTDAIKRQLISDVPLCTFLSGGLDSSAITAVAANCYRDEGKGQLHTYSIDYEGNDEHFKANDFQPNADAYWINQMTQEFGTVHHSCVIDQEKLKEYLTEAVLVRDLPGMADVDSSLLWFCEEIKQDFTVGLSGECADEIFGGYPWFHREDDFNRKGFPWMRSTQERQGLLKEEWSNKLNLEDYVLARYKDTVEETPLFEGESEEEAKRRQMFYLNQLWFMTTLLDRKDRMSMGASLEVRVPFADHRLVEYAWNIPWEMKHHEGREKGLLRKALEGILPDEVLYRKKSPYPKTHHPKYTELVRGWLSEILEDETSVLHTLFDEEKLKDIVQSGGAAFQTPWYGQLMTGPQLLAHLAQIHVWFKTYNIKIVS